MTMIQPASDPAIRACTRVAAFLALLLAGCAAPIGADRVTTRAVHQQLKADSLLGREPSADSVFVLRRYSLQPLFDARPEEALRQLHALALQGEDRGTLFALAELSFLTAERVRRSMKPWDPRDARDFYLGAAVYAYRFLFAPGRDSLPNAFDHRFRTACDLYNYGLGLAFIDPKGTNTALTSLEPGRRRLPVGEIELHLDPSQLPWPLEDFEQLLLSDRFRVRGLSVRNRQAGLGTPLIAVPKRAFEAGVRSMSAMTLFLRIEGSFQTLSNQLARGTVEVHSAFGPGSVQVGSQPVPLEIDSSVHLAYALNQTLLWRLERLQFLSLQEVVPTGVYLNQPYERGRIPVIFVHGTFSSPVWWAEMINTLRADPVLLQRCQFWFFVYNSSAPILISARRLREGITAKLQELDPHASDAALQQMTVIGHSQGGLLTKLTATRTGDQLWRSFNTNSLDAMDFTEAERAEVRRHLFLDPLPGVRRAVFISTPHRGSYRIGGFLRKLSRRLVSIPVSLANRGQELLNLTKRTNLPAEFRQDKVLSIDGMSPRNPVLRALAEIPVAPGVKAHSIIAVKGKGDYHDGTDGIVRYSSAHVPYVESEFIVRSGHSCQSLPATIEEVRRILHEHLAAQPAR